jgi:hypothetical protein
MKAIIPESLEMSFPTDVNSTDQDINDSIDEFCEVSILLTQFTVSHHISIETDVTKFIIDSQKITLDEVNMNTLFFNVFSVYFDVTINYAGIGGPGCDFAVYVLSKSKE